MITIRFFKRKDDKNHADSVLVDFQFLDQLIVLIRWWIKCFPEGRICYSNPAEMKSCLKKLEDRHVVALMESFL